MGSWSGKRPELHPLVPGRRIIAHARLTHFQGPCAGHDVAGRLEPIADHQAPTLIVSPVLVLSEEFLHLGLDGLLQQLLSAPTNELIQQAASIELLAETGNFPIEAGCLWIPEVKCRSLVHGVSFQPSLGPLMKRLPPAGYATFFLSTRTQLSRIAHKGTNILTVQNGLPVVRRGNDGEGFLHRIRIE
jgi:hypothetical protein